MEMNVYLPSTSGYADVRFAGACSNEQYFDKGLAIRAHVRNSDNICMARAIVLARATADVEHAKLHDVGAIAELQKVIYNFARVMILN